MSIPSDHVALFRDLRSDRYIDTVTITDLTSRGTWNRTTKVHDSATTSVVYTGSALIRPTLAASSRPSAGRAENRGETGEVLETIVVELPHTATGIGVGNTVTVDASTHSTDLVGQTMTVRSITHDSYHTYTRIECNLSQGGGDRG